MRASFLGTLEEWPGLTESSPLLKQFKDKGKDPIEVITKIAINAMPTRVTIIRFGSLEKLLRQRLDFFVKGINETVDRYLKIGPL